MPAKRILLIDDDPDIQDLVSLGLRLTGWEPLRAISGREGLEKAASEQPDAILLDVMMPDLDGPAIFGLLQQDPATRAIPVILMSAMYTASDGSFDSLGVAGKLPKPFRPLQLARQISALLEWPTE